jgi:hypothetical protein
MRTASWIILALMAGLILVGSLFSASVAYRPDAPDEFGVGGPKLAEVAARNPQLATAIRARRGTASAYSAAFAVLLLGVVAIPYRRGDAWAWWAVLASFIVLAAVILARVPTLGTRLGAPTGGVILATSVVALLLDVKRLKRPA